MNFFLLAKTLQKTQILFLVFKFWFKFLKHVFYSLHLLQKFLLNKSSLKKSSHLMLIKSLKKIVLSVVKYTK